MGEDGKWQVTTLVKRDEHTPLNPLERATFLRRHPNESVISPDDKVLGISPTTRALGSLHLKVSPIYALHILGPAGGYFVPKPTLHDWIANHHSPPYVLPAPSVTFSKFAQGTTLLLSSRPVTSLLSPTLSDAEIDELYFTLAAASEEEDVKVFGFRAWPTPFIRPMWPFLAGGALTFYGVAYAQSAMLSSPTYRDDPKNPFKSAPAAH
ncbi:hypothetical protein RQP46_010925 [Phenoliferia psychrophenolica]